MNFLLLDGSININNVVDNVFCICLWIIIVTGLLFAFYLYLKFWRMPEKKYKHEKDMKEDTFKHEKEWAEFDVKKKESEDAIKKRIDDLEKRIEELTS